jgi:uncharacterized protein YjdB
MRIVHERFRKPAVRRAAAWITAVVVAACSSSTSDLVTTGDVASVAVTPSTMTVSIGAQAPLQATVQDPSGKIISGAEVHWSIQNPSIATISNTGVVTGVALGSTQVAASAGGKSGIGTITVEKTPVASVVVRPSHVDAAPGGQTPFTAIAYDASQNPLVGRTITWTSSNTGVATIDANGVMTAVGPGSATITGTSEGKSDAATVSVTQAAVATVAVTPSPLSMSVGQSTQMTATLKDATGNVLNGRVVTWTSSSTGVATISAQGVLTAVATGTTTITATSEGKNGTAAVTITNVAVGSVTIQPQGPSIVQGASVQLSATVRDVNGAVVTDRAIAWSSSNSNIAAVSQSGVVTGLAPGQATITATSEGKSGTSSVTVTPIPVGSVTVAPSSASVRVTKTTTFAATVKDASGTVVTNRVVTWASSNPSVASVAGGVVTGVAGGTATITATSEGISGTASVTVTLIPVGSVTVSPASKSLLATQTFQLTATVKDSAGTVVTDRVVAWTSSNASVATVSSAGLVTAVAAGSATITATSETQFGTSAITVTPVPVGIVLVQPAKDTIAPSGTVQLSAVTEDSVGGILTGRTVTWSSGNAAVATVSTSGLVTATTTTGDAVITATSEGKSGTGTVTVRIPVATVTVAPATKTILVTQTTTFTATMKDAQGNVLAGRIVAWSTSNPAVATISITGVATGVAPGTVTINATSEGKTGTATLTVSPVPVSTVTVLPPSPDTVFIGYTLALSAVTKDSAGNVLTGRVITWASTAPSVATVSATGVVSGLTAGSTIISASSEGKVGPATVVSIKAPVGTVVISPDPDSVATSGTAGTTQLTATVTDVKGTVVTDRVVAWTSSVTANATVSATGLVTGKAKGTTNITATSETKSGVLAMNVVAAVTTVQVTPGSSNLSLLLLKTVQLAATCKDAGNATVVGRTITWSSSATGVATVDATGKVTAQGLGTATITARDVYDNVIGTATINVGP